MARAARQPAKLPNEDLLIPTYGIVTSAMPTWADDISKALVKQTDVEGSPGFDPGPEQAQQVEKLTSLGLSVADISATLRIEPKLLKKFYMYELETADKRTNAAVAKVALQLALSGAAPDMTKFWLKTRAGWKETKEVQMTGANGGPIQFAEVKQKMIDLIDAEIVDVEISN